MRLNLNCWYIEYALYLPLVVLAKAAQHEEVVDDAHRLPPWRRGPESNRRRGRAQSFLAGQHGADTAAADWMVALVTWCHDHWG